MTRHCILSVSNQVINIFLWMTLPKKHQGLLNLFHDLRDCWKHLFLSINIISSSIKKTSLDIDSWTHYFKNNVQVVLIDNYFIIFIGIFHSYSCTSHCPRKCTVDSTCLKTATHKCLCRPYNSHGWLFIDFFHGCTACIVTRPHVVQWQFSVSDDVMIIKKACQPFLWVPCTNISCQLSMLFKRVCEGHRGHFYNTGKDFDMW